MQTNLTRNPDEIGAIWGALEPDQITYKDSTYEIISKVSYLMGVPRRIFENDRQHPKLDIFNEMEKDKAARIVRHLCIVRTAIERNYKGIGDKMRTEYKTIRSVPEYIPYESLLQLDRDGVSFLKKSSNSLIQHVIEINRLINDRINNCRALFPLWLNWDYLKALFVMPDGLREDGVKAAAVPYRSRLTWYPYQMYINWVPTDSGNILYNDKKFVTLLYQMHKDQFTEFSKVSDVSGYVKGSIYDYIDSSRKLVVVVDCENSDPYKLCATFKNLDAEYAQKISSIILFNDIHTGSAWGILADYTSIPVEHLMVDRVKQSKSLVDITLAARACQEHYKNDVDSFIIVSSDSDYWGLITSLSEARFLMMIEHEHCGIDLKKALMDAGIFYCYIDDFYSGNAEELKHGALIREMCRYISDNVRLNINTMFEEALLATRADMSESEKKQFMARYVKTMQMSINDAGDLVIEFKRK